MARKKDAEIITVVKGPLVKKSESAAVRMSVISIDGVEMFDIRQYYRTRDSKEWLPTGKGFTMPLDETTVKAFSRFRKFVKIEVEGAP